MLAPPALWRTGSQTSSCVFIDLECCVPLRSQDSQEQQPCCEPATYRLAGYNEQMYRAQPSSQDESICTRENHESTQDVWSRLRLGGRCVCVHDAERSAEVGRLRPDPDDPAARHPNPDRHSDQRLRSRSELNRLSAAALRHNGAPDQPRIDTAPSGAVFFVVRSATSP